MFAPLTLSCAGVRSCLIPYAKTEVLNPNYRFRGLGFRGAGLRGLRCRGLGLECLGSRGLRV